MFGPIVFPDMHVHELMVVAGILLFGMAGGYLAHRTHVIPRITGYIAVGLIFGPSGLNLLNDEMIAHGRILVDLALGLILFTIGAHLNPRKLAMLKPEITMACAESTLSFVLMYYALVKFGISPVLALTAAAIGVSSSPAVILLVAKEFNAKGPVTESLLTITAVNNVLSFLAFSAILPFVHGFEGSGPIKMILHPLYLLFGSAALGGILGIPLGYLHRKLTRQGDMLLSTVGVIMATIGLSHMLHLSPLLAMLSLGAVAETRGAGERQVELEFGHAADIFYLSLFVISGAALHLSLLKTIGLAGVLFIFARIVGKCAGTAVTALLYRRERKAALLTGLGLVPMAGMAIGLAQTTSDLYPEFGSKLSAIVLSSIVVFETIGPFFTELALRKTGEISQSIEH